MNRYIFCLLLLPFLLPACHPKPIEGGPEIAREAEMHKPKRITPEQIFAEANIAGDSITSQMARLQQAKVRTALQNGGVAEALKYCNPRQYPELDSVLARYEVTPGRTSRKLRNPANATSGQVAQLLDAYQYNAENNLPQVANVQEKENGDLIYTKAIVISGALCLKCHGEPGKDIAGADLAILKTAYPADQATGYKLGELRGMWHITFPKTALAKSLSLKSQKKKRKR